MPLTRRVTKRSLTHLYDHAQVSDVHPLCLNDLHDDAVQVGQLRVRRHAATDEGGRLLPVCRGPVHRPRFVVVVLVMNEAPPLPVWLGARPLPFCDAPGGGQVLVQVDVGGSRRQLRGGEVVVSGGSRA